jgi:hypothetical protein
MLYKEMMAIYCKNPTTHTEIYECGKKEKIIFKHDCTYPNHKALKG